MRRITRRSCATALVAQLAIMSAASGARAQSEPLAPARAGDYGEPEESPRYRALITQAVIEMDAGHYPEARALFSEVHALAPNARTLRGLGVVAFELRDYVASVAFLEAALSSTRRPLTDAQRIEIAEVLTRARSFIGYVTIDLVPRDATVWIDGSKAVAQGAVPLAVGDHEFEARAEGYSPAQRAVHLMSGRNELVRIALTPERSASLAQPAYEGEHAARKWYANPWLWSAAAVLVGGAVAGVVVASRRDTRESVGDPVLSPNTPPLGALDALWAR